MPHSVVVVLPTYNEAENIEPMLKRLRGLGYGLVVVDDNSPDGTGRIAAEMAAADSGIDVIHRPRKEGLGPAYGAGFQAALDGGADIVCQMDADFSHDPDELSTLVETVAAGADVAIGSRYVRGGRVVGWPLPRRMLSRGGNRYVRLMLRLPIMDATSGFRATRAEALTGLNPWTCEASGYGFQVELTSRACAAGLEIVERPITFRDRIRGESKMNWRIAAEAMFLVTRWGLRRHPEGRRSPARSTS